MFLFCSCLTVKKIGRHCDDFARVCGTTKVTETKYRDTVIRVDRRVPVFVGKDTVRLVSGVVITTSGVQMNNTISKNGIITVRSKIVNSNLETEAYINVDSIMLNYKDSIRLQNALRTAETTSRIVVREKFVPQFYKLCFWIFIIEVVGVLLYSGFRIGRFFK